MAEKQEQKDLQLETVYSAPFSEPIGASGGKLGRWFEKKDGKGNVLGIIWTNDDKAFGYTPLEFESDAREENLQFRYDMAEQGRSATEAFDLALEYEEDLQDEVEIFTGDLYEVSLMYLKKFDFLDTVEEEPVTAAGPPSDEDSDISYGLTIGEDGSTVLELVLINTSGTYLRKDGVWEEVDSELDEEEYPTLYNVEWVEVQRRIIEVFDEKVDQKTANKDDFISFLLK